MERGDLFIFVVIAGITGLAYSKYTDLKKELKALKKPSTPEKEKENAIKNLETSTFTDVPKNEEQTKQGELVFKGYLPAHPLSPNHPHLVFADSFDF